MRSNKQGITINFWLNQRQVALTAVEPRRTCRAPASSSSTVNWCWCRASWPSAPPPQHRRQGWGRHRHRRRCHHRRPRHPLLLRLLHAPTYDGVGSGGVERLRHRAYRKISWRWRVEERASVLLHGLFFPHSLFSLLSGCELSRL